MTEPDAKPRNSAGAPRPARTARASRRQPAATCTPPRSINMDRSVTSQKVTDPRGNYSLKKYDALSRLVRDEFL